MFTTRCNNNLFSSLLHSDGHFTINFMLVFVCRVLDLNFNVSIIISITSFLSFINFMSTIRWNGLLFRYDNSLCWILC